MGLTKEFHNKWNFCTDAEMDDDIAAIGMAAVRDAASKGMTIPAICYDKWMLVDPAIKQAKIKIYRDLVGGKNRGGIFFVLNDGLTAQIQAGLDAGLGNNVRLFVTKDGRVFGCERALFRPDASIETMFTHHQRYWKNGRMTQAGGMTRDIGRWKFVDKMVVSVTAFEAYKKYVYEKIGILIGGWHEAAKKLKVRTPPIVKKHASGTAEIILGESSYIVKMTNPARYALEADVGRRVEWVLNSRKRANRIAKRIEVEITAALKKRIPK
jgi:hypothetical protein